MICCLCRSDRRLLRSHNNSTAGALQSLASVANNMTLETTQQMPEPPAIPPLCSSDLLAVTVEKHWNRQCFQGKNKS
jgi:hypothetical protein